MAAIHRNNIEVIISHQPLYAPAQIIKSAAIRRHTLEDLGGALKGPGASAVSVLESK